MAICKVCGKEFDPPRKNSVTCSHACQQIWRYERIKARNRARYWGLQGGEYDSKAKKETLCWKCAKATKDVCAWMRDGKPVEGWDATKMEVASRSGGRDYTVRSYCVKKCPEFERG